MISLVVAASQNHVIGKDNRLPWNMPADMAHFKRLTMGHPVIMGRRTHESIGKPLPGRVNIIITSDKLYGAPGCQVAGSLDEALAAAAKAPGSDEIFIIGGRRVFEEALPKAGRVYLTRIKADIEGDTYFNFDQSPWETITCDKHPADKQNPHPYNFVIMVRKSAQASPSVG